MVGRRGDSKRAAERSVATFQYVPHGGRKRIILPDFFGNIPQVQKNPTAVSVNFAKQRLRQTVTSPFGRRAFIYSVLFENILAVFI
jgi:hypothetical protein